MANSTKRSMGRAQSIDPGRADPGEDTIEIAWATVGHEEGSPEFVRIEGGQPWVEITIQPSGTEVSARLGLSSAGNGNGSYASLEHGCRVIITMVEGLPNSAVIVGQLWDDNCRMPGSVAGVSTGADDATKDAMISAPMWQFLRVPDGQLLAIETGPGGDILIHSGANIVLKTSGANAVHIDGTAHLGASLTSEPTGATVGPDGSTIPGTPAVARVPKTWSPPSSVPPVYVPFVGDLESIIRASDAIQISIATDPVNWALLLALFAHPLLLMPPPAAFIGHQRNSGAGKPGSKHTASD